MAVDLTQFGQVDQSPDFQSDPDIAASNQAGTVDLSAFSGEDRRPELEPERQGIGEEAGLGVARGITQLQSGVFNLMDLAGTALGSDSLREFSQGQLEDVEFNQQSLASDVPTLEDIEGPFDFAAWAAGKIGEQIPILGTMLAGGGAGGALGGAVTRGAMRNGIRRGVVDRASARMQRMGMDAKEARTLATEQLAQPGTQEFIRRALSQNAGRIRRAGTTGSRVGAGLGAFQVGGALNTAEVQAELREGGIDSPLTAVAAGAAAGILDAAPVAVLIDRLFPGVDRAIAKTFVQDIAGVMGVQTALEGGTEAAQEAVILAARAFHDPSFNPLNPTNKKRILEAAAVGALVGGASGGVAAVGGRAGARIRRGKETVVKQSDRMRNFVGAMGGLSASQVDQEADSLIPGMGELRAAASGFVQESVVPLMESVRQRASEAVSGAQAALGTTRLGMDVEGMVSETEAVLQRRVSPLLAEAMARMHQQIDAVRDQAAQLAESERAQFLQEQLQRVRQDITNFVEQRIKPLVERGDEELRGQAETRDFDDDELFDANEDQFEDSPDPDELRRTEDATRLRLGAFVTEDITARNRTGGVSRERLRLRSRGADAVPLTRSRAEKVVADIRQQFPGVDPGAIDVEQVDGGFVVALRDALGGEEIFTQLQVIEQMERARINARLNPNKNRQVRIKMPGKDTFTTFDLPTLSLLGQNLIERQGVALPERTNQRSQQGFDEIMGRLLDMGAEIDGRGLNNKLVFEQGDSRLTIGRARGQAQFSPAQTVERRARELTRDQLGGERPERSIPTTERLIAPADPEAAEGGPTIGFQRSGVAEEQIQTTEERGRETEEEQARASARQRPDSRPDAGRATEQWWRGARRRVNMGILDPAMPQAEIDAIETMVDELAKMTGLRNRIFVLDQAGAEAMVRAEHPASSQLAQAVLEDPTARIIFYGDQALMYVSPRVLVDQNTGSVDAARLRTATVISHELGHLVERSYFNKLSDGLKAKLQEAFDASGFEAKNPNNAGNDFEEWMANQFTAWAARNGQSTRTISNFFGRGDDRFSPAKTKAGDLMQTLDQYFGTVVYKLRQMFDWIKNRFGLDETFDEFMQGVTEAAAGRERSLNPFTQHFLNEGITGYTYHQTPAENDFDFDTDQLRNVGLGLKARINAKLEEYPGVRQAAIRTWESTLSLHDMVTASLNGRLRARGIAAMDALADKLNFTPGSLRTASTYFNNRQLATGRFGTKIRNIMGTQKKPRFTERQKMALLRELEKEAEFSGVTGDPAVDVGLREIRGLFEEMFAYMRDAGLLVDEVPNYFPRVWNSDAVADGTPRIIDKLIELGATEKQAQSIAEAMAAAGNEAAMQANTPDDTMNDVPFSGNIKERNAWLDDPFFNEFRSSDLDRILERYLQATVNRAEFNRSFGQDARELDDGQAWDPRAELRRLEREALTQGADDKDIRLMRQAVDAALGRLGRDDISTEARQTMAWVATYQNLRLLLFSTLASLPDIVGPAIRSNDFKSAFNTLRNNFKEVVDGESDLNEVARTWGIISDALNNHILTEQFDNHWFPQRAREINEKFFKAIGLERWTNFTRSAALAVGRDAIIQWSSDSDVGARNLGELGLTQQDVREWLDDGQRVFGRDQDASEADRRVAEALVQFVNESIMRPDPSQRPLWASNPKFMLVFHLKSFMYAFHNTVIRQLVKNFQQAETPWEKAYVAAVPAMMMMAITGLGLELRELLQYKLWGRAGRTDRMDGPEYIWELAQRSGIFGVSQLALDWEGADERGQLPFMAVAGPTLNQLNDLVSKPLSQTVPKAIPGVSQIPTLRQLVRDVTPL
jgi:hypothetical protein